MIPVDAILFDLDGTLVDSRKDLANSIRVLQRLYRHPVSSLDEVASFIGDGVVALVQRALPDIHGKTLYAAVDAFKRHYRHHCLEHTKPYPGVKAVLRHFQQKPLAVVTNKPYRVSARILDGLGLSGYFSVLIGGDSLPRKKPHPEPLLNALRTLGLKPSRRILMVGDGPNDVLSGRAARILTCAIRSNIADYQITLNSRPDYRVTRITELMRKFN